MTNAVASNTVAGEASVTEFVIQKPSAGTNIMVDLIKDQPTSFNFAVEDIRAMKLLADGGLFITFVDGSTLTLTNFKAARESFPFNEIEMSDGTVVNMNKLAQGLDGTLPQDTLADLTILKPQGENAATLFSLQEGKTYTLGFDMSDVAGVEAKGDDLVVTFKDGTTLTLENYENVNDGALPPQMTLADGSVIPASQLINVLNVAVAEQVKDIQPAAGETSADAEAKVAAQQAAQKQASAEDLAAIEPAAGGAGAAGGSAGGYGFNSSVDPALINPLNPIGPLGVTELAFGLPQLKINPSASNALAAPGTTTLVSPDRQTFEDTEVNLQISASGANPAQNILTITVSGIPTGWTVDIVKSGGTYNAGTGTWTITLPQGQSFNGGPYITPPKDSDADIMQPTQPPLTVTVSSLDTVSGTTDVVTDDMNVLVDAVADQPDLAVQNSAGSDNGPAIPLNIQAAVVDTDGSEVLTTATLTGIPAGFILNHGTYNAGTQTWTVNAVDLPNLTLMPVKGFDGVLNITVRVNNTEANLTDLEITTANNNNFNQQTFQVTIVDTTPAVGDSSATVDDTTLQAGNNVVTGSVTVNFQLDGGAGATFGPAPANTFASSGSKLGGNLTSNGFPVTVTLNGDTYTGTANGQTIFTMQVQANGNYTFTQMQQLDHQDATNPNDSIQLNFTVTATDDDSDTDTGIITINVLDDGPIAFADNFVGTTNATGNITTNDDFSEDTFASGAANKVYDVVFGGQTVVLPTNGTNATISNGAGTLVINNNGVFTYTPLVPGTDATFKYRLIDYDNDLSAATAEAGTTVTIDLDGSPSITGSAVTTDETNLDNSGVAQTVNGTYTFSYGSDGAGSISATGYTGPALTSNGNAVTVTQAPAGTFTGTANGQTVFTMVIRNDGTYTFTQNKPLDHPNPNDHDDALNLTFGVTITDSDGDTATASLTATVRDDGPVAVNDNFVSATATATGNIMANDDVGADEPGRVHEVTFGGTTVLLNPNGSDHTINNGAGTLVINSTGQFTFTPPVPGQGTTFTYKLIDFDGDISTVSANNGTVTIDTNGTPTITGSSVTTDDTVLDNTGAPQTVTGTYTFSFGGDGQGAGGITTAYTGPNNLTSGGQAVTVTKNGNTYTGTANGQTVFTMTIGTNGTYSFTQNKPLDHPNPNDHDDALNLTFGVTVTDADGSTATGTLTAIVRDDGPVAVADNFVSSTGTATGNIMTNDDVGADEPGRVFDVFFGGETKSLPADGSNVMFDNGAGKLTINSTGQFTFTPPLPGQDVTFKYRLIDFDGDMSATSAQDGTTVTITTDAQPIVGDQAVNTDETSLVAGPAVTNGNVIAEFFGDGPGTITATNTFQSSGSKLGGNLTSNGSPVTVTLAGNTYTGQDALGNTVFTLLVNANGTFTFTQFEQLDHNNPADVNDIITLNFGIRGTDTDGDTDDGSIVVNVRDDAPAAQDDQINLAGGNSTTGNVRANDILGQDAPVPVTQVVYNAITYTVPTNGTNLTIVAAHGTLVINRLGDYTYTANANSPGTDTFTYRITDFDGDSSTANLGVTVTDVDFVPAVGDSTVTVDETTLNAVGTGTITANYFADGPGTLAATSTFSSGGSKLNGQLTSNGSLVTVTTAGNTFTGKDALGNTVFTLVLQANGNYTYTQFRTLDHQDSNNANDVINLNFTVIGTDADGDTDTGVITVNVLDDAPVAVNDTVSVSNVTPATGNLLDNDDKSNDTPNLISTVTVNGTPTTLPANGSNVTINGTFGTLVINNTGAYTYTSKNTAEGTDTFTYVLRDYDQDPSTGTFTATVTDINTTPIVTTTTTSTDESGSTHTVTGTITANFGDDGPGTFLVCSGQNFSSDGSRLNNKLSSGGVDVNVTSTSTGYTGTANGQTVFTLTLNSNGSYTFTQVRPLDHANPNDPNDIINLNFQVCARDADGSVGHGTLTIQVIDDAPVARNDTTIFCGDDYGTNGNVITGWHNNNGSAGVDDATSFDNPTWLYSITGSNGSEVVPVNGAAVVKGTYGYLFVFADGSYSYATFDEKTGQTDTFTYLLKDGDGDTEAATLTLTSVARGVTHNDSLIVATANGTTNGTSGNDFIMAITPGSSETLNGNGGNDTIYGWDANDVLNGGSGNDVLFGEYGNDSLTGGTGTDIFVASWTDFNWNGGGLYDRVKDFSASQGDVIDLSGIIEGNSIAQNAINNYVRAVNQGGDTMLQVRANGSGAWKNAMLIEGHTNMDVQTLLTNGNLDV